MFHVFYFDEHNGAVWKACENEKELVRLINVADLADSNGRLKQYDGYNQHGAMVVRGEVVLPRVKKVVTEVEWERE